MYVHLRKKHPKLALRKVRSEVKHNGSVRVSVHVWNPFFEVLENPRRKELRNHRFRDVPRGT
jgi:hypothetical protein